MWIVEYLKSVPRCLCYTFWTIFNKDIPVKEVQLNSIKRTISKMFSFTNCSFL